MMTRKQFVKSVGVLLASLTSLPLISKLIDKWNVPKEEAILRLYSEMLPMIKERLEYEGFARQVLAVRKLKQGELQRYTKKIGVTSMMIQEDGKTIEAAYKWDKLFPTEFAVSATSWLPPEFIKAIMAEPREHPKGFFEFVDRELDKLTFNIMFQEDRNALRLLYHSAMQSRSILHIDQLDRKNFNQFKRMAKDNSFVIDKLVMNRTDYLEVFKKNADVFAKINMIVLANAEEVKTRAVSIPEGMIFILPKPEEFGIMPERVSLTALSAERMMDGKRQKGALMVEQISQVIFDTRKVIVAMKPDCVVPKWMEENPVLV